jgi:acetyl-CoA acetyltransferase
MLESGGRPRRARVDPKEVDAVFVGNVIHSSPAAPYLARHVSLRAGVTLGSSQSKNLEPLNTAVRSYG